MGSLALDELPGRDSLEALSEEWTDLWHRCPTATPFQSPAWLIPWARRFGSAENFVLTLRRGGRLVGLMPFFVWDPGDGRTALPAGIGISDYLDGCFAADEERACAAAVLDHLGRDERWSAIELQELRPESALLDAATPLGWQEERSVQSLCPVLDLPPGDPLAGLPSKMRANLRYYGKRAARAGTLRLEAATEATLPHLLDGLIALHGNRWRSRGEEGMLAGQALQALHAEAAPALLDLGALRLHALFLDERMIAAVYGFVAGSRFYYYLSGLDPDLMHLSPGTLIIGRILDEITRDGVRSIDFLRGQEGYKYLWGATDRPTWRRRLVRRNRLRPDATA